MLVADTPNRIYTSERRTTTHGPPIECPKCHRLPTQHPPARMLCETKPGQATMGSFAVDCPSCGSFVHSNNPELTDADHERHDIRDMFREEQHRGTRGGGSGNKGPKKPRPKRQPQRLEQEMPSFSGRRSAEIVVINTERKESTKRVHLRLTINIVARMRASKERTVSGLPVPLTTMMRQAMAAHLTRLRTPAEYNSQKTSIYARLYESEIAELKRQSDMWEIPMGDLVENCVERMLGAEE